MKIYFPFFLSFFLLGCSTHYNSNTSLTGSTFFSSDYEKLVNSQTKKGYGYYGLDNTYEVKITFLTSKIQEEQLKKKKEIFKFAPREFVQKQRQMKRTQNKSVFFIDFYSPEREVGKLSRSHNLWKLYLYVNGRKLKGKIKSLYLSKYNRLAFYPTSSSWGSLFLATFDTPVKDLEKKSFKVKFTGPVGEKDFNFN